MTPQMLLFPDSVVRENGSGPALHLGDASGKPLLLTLSINRMIEQQSLDVEIWGSANGRDWGKRPLLVVPRKYYCGICHFMLDLSESPEVRCLRAAYRLTKPGSVHLPPLAEFSLSLEAVEEAALATAGA